MIHEVDCFGVSHVGMVRLENEDNFFVANFECSLKLMQAGKGLTLDRPSVVPDMVY